MGDRAHLYVIKDGKGQLYYDHWSAIWLDVDLFWGPEETLQYVEQIPCEENTNGWMDNVWCDGAALIDYDKRNLIFFCSEECADIIPWRRIHLAMMKLNWPNWNVEWAYKGLLSITDYLNLPGEDFAEEFEVGSIGKDFFPCENYDPELHTVLISKSSKSDGLQAWLVFCGFNDLAVGPTIFEEARNHKSVLPTSINIEEMHGGLHADFEEKKLYIWWGYIELGEELESIKSYWPGWEVICLWDIYEDHLKILDGQVVLEMRSLEEIKNAVVDRIESNIYREPSNMLLGLMGALTESGKEAKMNPHSNCTRGSVGNSILRSEIVIKMRFTPVEKLMKGK